MSNSSAVAQQIARSLVAAGVREVVLAPGSRSAPLVYALAPLAEAGVIRIHVRLDERDAGFLALGLARGLRVRDVRSRLRAEGAAGVGETGAGAGSAVAIVTTSGSAVANLHPAVLEASYGHLPLVAITADRPARLRGTGANQTIDDQARVLTDVRARFDVPTGAAVTTSQVRQTVAEAVARSLGREVVIGERRGIDDREVDRPEAAPRPAANAEAELSDAVPGPVQLNVQFDTTLVPTGEELDAWQSEIIAIAAESDSADVSAESLADALGADRSDVSEGSESDSRAFPVALTPGTVIVAGDAGGWPAVSLERFARDHDLPVLAEPSSPLARTSEDERTTIHVPAHARVLTERPDLREVIRTVIVHGKPTLSRPVAALLSDPEIDVQRLPDDIDAVGLTGSATESCAESSTWRETWVQAGILLSRDGTADGPEALARAVADHLARQSITLFAASSNTIRYLGDLPEIRADVHASRGLAGIDGLVSTATGLSLGLDEPVVLLIGDIALLHDVGGLLTPSSEVEGDVTIVVLNDDGGAIFGGLEHSQPHVLGYLDQYFAVPHGRRFDQLADAYGWTYARVSTLAGFVDTFAQMQSSARAKRTIIEVELTV